MGPKTFTPCYICSKEFGVKSLTFHEPKCLQRWRSLNKALPPEKRLPTPVKQAKDKNNNTDIWTCPNCHYKDTASKQSDHLSICPAQKLKTSANSNRMMTGTVKSEFISPKKGKENKKNGISELEKGKNAKNDSLDPLGKIPEEVCFTSNRSVRPQTKILRRPTPNLRHPVILVDSDDSSNSSEKSCKDDDNPKRLKMTELSSDAHKPKNFILYNKNNVEKNTKIAFKERVSANTTIPNPCNSCDRNQAPERLHSHAKKDSRGLMFRRSPSLDVKMASPLRKSATTKPPKTAEKKLDNGSNDSQNTPQEPEVLTPAAPDSSISVKELDDIMKTCYICQEEFKVSSLLLHESKCLEEWKKTNNSLTPNLRKLPPRRPVEPKSDENDPAWIAVQSQLVPCERCGRTFFPERLPVHGKVCKGKPSPRAIKRTSSLREPSADGEDGQPSVIYVPCHVCNRSYDCWKAENDKLPSEQRHTEPEKLHKMTEDEVASLVELGDDAWESHLQQLVPCPLCSRTFFPDRLGVHKRSCKGSQSLIYIRHRPKSNNDV